jgi:hypothetical protein
MTVEMVASFAVGVLIGIAAAAIYLHSHQAKAIAAVTQAFTDIAKDVSAVKTKV